MSEHAFVAILGIAFSVVFLGGLLELTRLRGEEPEGQHEGEEPEGQHEGEEPEGQHEGEEPEGQHEETPHEPGYVEATTFTRRFFGDILLEGLLFLVTLVIGWYVWLFFTAKTAQTPAKRLLNVYILDNNTQQPVSAGRVWVREVLVKILVFDIAGSYTLGIALLINHAWALFDDKRQALHDKIVSTVVVYAPNGLPEAQAARASVGAPARGVSDVATQLRELAKLREEGILTEEEYETKRKQLADEL